MIFDKSKFEQTEVDGVVNLSYTDEDAYKHGSKEFTTLSFTDLKNADNYRNKYIEEATELAAQEGKRIMEKNKKVDKVIVTVPFSTSKRGSIDISVDRSKTFQGMKGGDPVTKSKITTVVHDPISKVSKSKIKELESELTAVLVK